MLDQSFTYCFKLTLDFSQALSGEVSVGARTVTPNMAHTETYQHTMITAIEPKESENTSTFDMSEQM